MAWSQTFLKEGQLTSCVCWCFWAGASAHVGYQAPCLLAADAEGAAGPPPPGAPTRPPPAQRTNEGAGRGPKWAAAPRPPGSANDLYANLVWVIYDLKPNVTQVS